MLGFVFLPGQIGVGRFGVTPVDLAHGEVGACSERCKDPQFTGLGIRIDADQDLLLEERIAHALRDPQALPQYEADDGPLTAAQARQIKKRIPQGGKRSVRSNLFDTETA